MKQKMKKCLCLMLSFVFVFSNCQLFAQSLSLPPAQKTVTLKTPVSEEMVTEMKAELKQLHHDFDAMKKYIDRLFGDSKHAEIRGFVKDGYNEFLVKFEKPYVDFINEVNAYDTYVAHEVQKTPMERLAYKYTRRDPGAEHFAAGYSIEEGSVFSKMRKDIDHVISFGPEGVNYRTTSIVNEIPGVEQIQERVNAALSHVEERLALAENQINRISTGNEKIRKNLTKFLEESGTTADDVVEYALRTIPEHDLKFLGLVKKTELAKVSKFRMAVGWKKYLKAIGSRHRAQSSVFKLMRSVSAQSIHSAAYQKGYKNLLDDFPVLPKRGYNKVSRLGRKALTATPLAVLGAFLTASVIIETRSDNSFFADTIGPRAMSKIEKKIDNEESSIGESLAYYNSPWSETKWGDKNINKNVKHFINVINLAIATGKADEEFDDIDKLFVEEEQSLALAEEVVNDEVQNKLDKKLANISDKVLQYENMI